MSVVGIASGRVPVKALLPRSKCARPVSAVTAASTDPAKALLLTSSSVSAERELMRVDRVPARRLFDRDRVLAVPSTHQHLFANLE